jgi:hypothetical protein
MRESRTYGSVRGALSNERPYRDRRFAPRNDERPCPELASRVPVGLICHCIAATNEADLPDGLPAEKPVQPHLQKYFASPVGQIISRTPAVLSRRRGVAQRHQRGVGCGGRGRRF